jgi:hypothetical protein
LPENSLTILSFSSKLISWFVQRARRCLLINLGAKREWNPLAGGVLGWLITRIFLPRL